MWLNWIIRQNATGVAAGYVQATVSDADGARVADLAWVVAPCFQRQGIARAAARTVSAFLRQQGVDRLRAEVHPDHVASQRVASALGLRPTDEIVDGETRWAG